MLTLSEMATLVGQKVGKTDTTSLSVITNFLKRRYEMIYDNHLWMDSKVLLNMSTSNSQIVLPNYVERVVGVKKVNSSKVLQPEDPETIFQIEPTIYDNTGDPRTFFAIGPPLATGVLMDSGTIDFVSSSTSDTSNNVEIIGLNGTTEVQETVTLNGTTTVTSSNAFTEIYQIALASDPVGTITVTDTGSTTILTLLPGQRTRRHIRIQLEENPDASYSYLILCKRNVSKFEDDQDVPLIRGVDNALLAYAQGDALEWTRQYSKAQAKFAEGAALVQRLLDAELSQSARHPRLIPDPGAIYETDRSGINLNGLSFGTS